LAQRGQKQWRNALEGLQQYVLERLRLRPEAVGKVRTSGRSLIYFRRAQCRTQVFALFVHRRRTFLRTMQVTYNSLNFPEKLPKDTDLLNKDFVDRASDIIDEYRRQLGGRGRDGNSSHIRPPPSSAIDMTTGLSADQKTMLRGLVAMLRVTNFQWEKKSNLKGVSQVIKALGPSIMSASLNEELLTTKDSWSMRTELQAILTQNMTEGEWKWWDGVNSRPGEEGAGDDAMVIQPLPEESAGNTAARAWLVPQLRQESGAKIQKIIDTVMQPGLGYMVNNGVWSKTARLSPASPQLHQALRDFVMVSISSTERKRAPANPPFAPSASRRRV
jgi:hypothetical protein